MNDSHTGFKTKSPGRLRETLALAMPLVLPLLCGLVLRLWFIAHAARIAGDTLVYGDIAKNWMEHWIYGFTRVVHGVTVYRPTLIRLPGYPLFLMLCFRLFGLERYDAVMLVQGAIDLGTCVLLGTLAGRLFGPKAGKAALWLAVLCPFTACYVAAPLTETLTLACIALAFYALERWQSAGGGVNRWLPVIGAALAYAVLLRPEQGMLAAAVVPAMLWFSVRSVRPSGLWGWRRAVLPALLVSVLTVLPLAPWTIRNLRTFHVLQPLAPRFATDPGEAIPYGFQRWYRTWAVEFVSTEEVYWNYDGAPIDIGDLPNRAFDSNEQYDATEALLEEYDRTSNASRTFDQRFDAIASERIHNDPLRYYLAMPVGRVLNMILRPRTEMMAIPLRWWRFNPPGKSLFAGSYALLNFAYLALAAVGFARWKRCWSIAHASLAWPMAATILMRCALLLTLDNSEPRYTLEFFPVVIVFAAALWMRE